MPELNSEKESLRVEEIMAKIYEKIEREQGAEVLPLDSESPEEEGDFDEAKQDAFWEQHKKNLEFHFWDRHLLPINNLWKELMTEEQLESEETKVVKFEFWHRFLMALNQKWQLTHIQPLPASPRPLIGRILNFLRIKIYTWLHPVFEAQQIFNSTLVQFINELVDRLVQLLSRIIRLERKLDKQRALSGEAVKFYNEVVRFLTEEMPRIDRKIDRETFRLESKLIGDLTTKLDALASISSYCAFMEHRQEIMETQIKELQTKIQELEKKLNL
jgi:hypothetical protein